MGMNGFCQGGDPADAPQGVDLDQLTGLALALVDLTLFVHEVFHQLQYGHGTLHEDDIILLGPDMEVGIVTFLGCMHDLIALGGQQCFQLCLQLGVVIFAGNTGTEIAPTKEEVEGFNKYIEAYKKGLEIEKMAVECKA